MNDPLLRYTDGPTRTPIDAAELDAQGEAVVVDPRRRRPRYFDGRFLAARDLTRDQSYFLARQADLGRIVGGGVAHGLGVTLVDATRTLRIAAGHGLTPAGELVLLREDLTLDLHDITQATRLDALFGLEREPRPPTRTLSGLFVLALRPVEYTANPTAAYPRTLTGDRGLEDGDVVEAVAVTLVPYPLDNSAAEIDRARSAAAREIFVRDGTRGMPADALPLAMLGLRRGVIDWLDPWLVRRDVGVGFSLGTGRRAIRESFVQQHLQHLAAIVAQAGPDASFAASDHFHVLPPVGQVPRAAIRREGDTLVQVYFPPEVAVSLSVVPHDEVLALVEESLPLPPIDLALGADALRSIAVSVLVPVPRESFASHLADLQTAADGAEDPRTLELRSTVPRRLAPLRPLERLTRLQVRRRPPPALDPTPLELAPWVDLLGGAQALWFVRRRNLAHASDAVVRIQAALGTGIDNGGEEPADPLVIVDPDVQARIEAVGELARYEETYGSAAAGERRTIDEIFLGNRRMLDQPLLISGLVEELEVADRDPNRRARLLEHTFARWSDRALGEGTERLRRAVPDLDALAIRRVIARALRDPELDGIARDFRDAELTSMAEFLLQAADKGNVGDIQAFADTGGLRDNPLVRAMYRHELVDRRRSDAAAELFSRTLATTPAGFGRGLDRLLDSVPSLKTEAVAKALAEGALVRRVDAAIGRLPGGSAKAMESFGRGVRAAVEARDTAALEEAVARLEEVGR